ncbi:hypothetical protein CALCODRAFT_512182 [Calocera cornea HHB12733]|uniref:Uncharacterized protein n=1 Tax=Calocera cornea HHB12733 TaxID=1353952 RepID=A0A165D7M4_9BASI|nr:hypothetical protein CALCODRAFT_512182 [Calocera cornea HHB12733]
MAQGQRVQSIMCLLLLWGVCLNTASANNGDRSTPLHTEYDSVHGSDVAPSSNYSFVHPPSVSSNYSHITLASAIAANNAAGKVIYYPQDQDWCKKMEPDQVALLSTFYCSPVEFRDRNLQVGDPTQPRHPKLGEIVSVPSFGDTAPIPFEAITEPGPPGITGYRPPTETPSILSSS